MLGYPTNEPNKREFTNRGARAFGNPAKVRDFIPCFVGEDSLRGGMKAYRVNYEIHLADRVEECSRLFGSRAKAASFAEKTDNENRRAVAHVNERREARVASAREYLAARASRVRSSQLSFAF